MSLSSNFLVFIYEIFAYEMLIFQTNKMSRMLLILLFRNNITMKFPIIKLL